MESIEKYLNADEKELLSLTRYHLVQFDNKKKKQGKLQPEEIEIINHLFEIESMVLTIAGENKEILALKQIPTLTECPECEVEKVRKPIGEEKSEQGYMCNCYYCDKCEIEYLDYRPNNGKDQLSWTMDILQVLEKNKEKLASMPDEIKNYIIEMKKQYETLKNVCAVEEEAEIKFIQAMEKRHEVIVAHRDYLLACKIKNQWGSLPMGEC